MPRGEVVIMNPVFSYHSPLSVDIGDGNISGPHPFRFFNCLADHKDFMTVMEIFWARQVRKTVLHGLWLRIKADYTRGVLSTFMKGIRIKVRSVYIEGRSHPSKGLYFFAYRISITNNSDRPVQLLRRHWIITDANGKTENVWGIGVIGEQPVIHPNTGFEYSSACPLGTPSGRMIWLSGFSLELQMLKGNLASSRFCPLMPYNRVIFLFLEGITVRSFLFSGISHSISRIAFLLGYVAQAWVWVPDTGVDLGEGDFEMKHIDRVGSRTFNVAIAPFSLSKVGDGSDTFSDGS
ncbi:Protein ApaG [Capsicum annuum]|nr:Protein ApaG [Capsicum annuum]